MPFEAAMGIESIALNCLESADINETADARKYIFDLYCLVSQDANCSRNKYVDAQLFIMNRQRRKTGGLLLSIGVILFFAGLSTVILSIGGAALIAFGIVNLIPLKPARAGNIIPNDNHTSLLVYYAERIQYILDHN